MPTLRSILYYGSKYKLSDWIISFFPSHHNFIDVCGGSASILINKPRSPLETFNDLSSNVVNFFTVLREREDELIRAIEMTPYARAEYELHREPTDDPLEAARRFYVGCEMSIVHQPYTNSGMRVVKNKDNRPGKAPSYVWQQTRHLQQVAARFSGVQIECMDYKELVKRYDWEDNLFYFDPPYVTSTRSSHHDVYAYEWTDEQHAEAAEIFRAVRGFVVVSGYSCPLYDELYRGWRRFDKEAITNSGSKKIESLWLSPNIKVEQAEQLSL
jgi:DNA adenine methylase